MPATRTPRPQSVAFELTWRCDQSCSHCYNVWKEPGAAPPPEREPGTEEIKQLVTRAVRASGTEKVVLTGGEPLLRPDALEILEHASGLARTVMLVTNGSRIDPAAADAIAGPGNVSVQITLLGGTRDVHDAMKGGPSFDGALEGIVALRERKVRVVICFVCTSLNHGELGGVMDLAYALGVRDVVFNRMAPAGDGARNLARLGPTVEMIEQCLETANEASERTSIGVTTAIPVPPCLVSFDRYPRVKFAFCSSASSRPNFVVDFMGNVRSCNLSPHVLGNLATGTWRKAMRSPYLRTFARALPRVCRGCRYESSCRGGCKESARACSGSLEAEEPLLSHGRLGAGSS
jgi:radical SAM protein with 4Fe4S-binding SPASM domain